MANDELWQIHLNSLDGEVYITCETKKRKRSLKQNAYYWGVALKYISDETGYSVDETHSLMKTFFMKKHLDFRGKRYTIIQSTASLSSLAFMEYIEQVKQWAAAELALSIPSPDEIYL